MKLFGLKTCETCRKALKNLSEVEFVDIRGQGVPQDILERAYDEFGDSLLNTRSITWRGLDENQRALPPMTLLRDHPTLMKRPLIEAHGKFYLGWGKDVQLALGEAADKA